MSQLQFTSSQLGANSDYMPYVYGGSLVKTDKLNSPQLLDFSLLDYDGNMTKLVRGAHISLFDSNAGRYFFTGYITSDPQPTYVGSANSGQVYQYSYEATSDEYILNVKPLGLVRPFTNTTQGAVLRALIQRLSPAGVTFDTSHVQDGQALARYVCDPNQHFSDVVKDFSDAANYQFRVMNYAVTFSPQDAVACGVTVDGANDSFTPSALQLTASTDPIINDSIILGDIEPQNYMNEFFVGDGATAQYPLISSVFGVDSTLLLDDDFSSSTIDNSKWTLYDANAQLLPYNGFLNVIGGDGAIGVSLQSVNLLPLEGVLRITHGEYDFVSASDGLIGSLWSGQTNQSLAGCIYGIRVQKWNNGTATSILHPQVGSLSLPDQSQAFVVDLTKRYIFRTLISFSETKRQIPTYSYKDASGSVITIQQPPAADTATFQTIITEIDPTNANITNKRVWSNTITVGPTFAYYVAVASNDMHCTVTGITISAPMQATLNTLPSGGSQYTAQLIGPNEIDSMDGLAPVATIVDSNNGASTRSSFLGTANYNPGQATLTYFKDSVRMSSRLMQPGDVSRLTYRSAGAAIGRAQDKVSIAAESAAFGDDGLRSETKRDLSPLPRTSQECEAAAVARIKGNSFQHWTGTYTIPSGFWVASEPYSGTILKFINLPSQFPSGLKAEAVTQVKSTLVSIDPFPRYIYEVQFGPVDLDARMVSTLQSTNNVFAPQDTVEMPEYIDVSSLGQTSVPSIPTVSLNLASRSSVFWSLQFDNVPNLTKYGIQMRYTDTGWGADVGKNFIQNIESPIFNMSRTDRGRIAFLRLYDKRNMVLYSELIEEQTPGLASLASVRAKMPDGSQGMVGKVTAFATSSAGLPDVSWNTTATVGGVTYTFTVSCLAPVGTSFTLAMYDAVKSKTVASKTVVGTGGWQRVSVTGTPTAGTTLVRPELYGLAANQTAYVTRASLEYGAQETVYCKTLDQPFGAMSRYSTGVHIALPNVPPPPTLQLDLSTNTTTSIKGTVVLPANLSDVWGVEIRGSNDSTILYRGTIADIGLSLTPTLPKSGTTTTYFARTYNLLGDYSVAFETSI